MVSAIGKNWTEWPAFHPRKPEIIPPPKPRKIINVADPDNEIMTPAEWKELSKGSTEKVSRLAVSESSLGPGRLDITKTTYSDGTYLIYPALIPNNLTDQERSIGKCYTARGDDWPFKDGAAAIQAIRLEFQVVLKIDQKKGS